MNLKDKILQDYICRTLDNNSNYQECLEIIRLNSCGKIWLFGSGVYRTLANYPLNLKIKLKDYDFIVENVNSKIELPRDWEVIKGKFANPKFKNIKKNLQTDIVPLDNIYHLKKNYIKPNIETFLLIAPLNIFSLVYDINKNKLIGDMGKRALEERVVRVNNLDSLKEMALLYKKSVNQIIDEKAKTLNFKAEYPY